MQGFLKLEVEYAFCYRNGLINLDTGIFVAVIMVGIFEALSLELTLRWRKQPDLAEAVAAIRALSSVIRCSQSDAMMELIHELQSASDALKVRRR
ncbi:Initiation factor 2B-related protein [Artemisia annua]|uniref:Initiation factor 2B-related protein n=1 Tax=Artemisia annua TaxID=35608 RepID=A0A2U1LGL3_ARTAN|nr:Initiation factor 2B-related protein [Artemisia annua]